MRQLTRGYGSLFDNVGEVQEKLICGKFSAEASGLVDSHAALHPGPMMALIAP